MLPSSSSTQVDTLKKKLADAEKRLTTAQENAAETESRLLEERQKYADLYENAPDMYVSVCPKTRTVTQCNQTLLNCLGYERDEVIGHDLMNLYHASCHNGVAVAFKTFVEQGEIRGAELVLKRKDGSALDVSLKVTAVRDEQGNILYSRSAWRDISAQKRIEKQLRQREQELHHFGRLSTMGELAAQIAHELNQPLGSVTNFIAGCRERLELGTIDNNELVQIVTKAESEARRASEILSRLRRMALNIPIEFETIDLHAAIQESFALLNPSLNEIGIRVQFDFCESKLQVHADRIQLEQVFVNLIANSLNALKRVDRERNISVATRLVDGKIEITFADNGPGFSIDPRTIFKPFESGTPTGMGLGLSICRSIIRSFEGVISASNSEMFGAVICIELPVTNG